MALTYFVTPWSFSWSSFYFNIEIFTKINGIFWNKFSSIVTVNWIGCSKYTYPLFQKKLYYCVWMFVSSGCTLTEKKRENWSIKWRYQRFSFKWWRSIATLSWKDVALGNDTTGLGTGFLYRLHESHSFVIFSTIWNKLLSYISTFFNKTIKLLLEACPNCLSNFFTVFCLLSSVSLSLKIETSSISSKLDVRSK